MLRTQVPIVSVVRGWAAGIGLNLTLASDFTVAADDARFWAPFVGKGFTPDSGATWLLPRRVGDVRARDMVLLGRVVSGTEAAGLGDDPPGRPRRRARHRRRRAGAATLAGSATVALGLAKWLMNSGHGKALDDQLHGEAFSMELLLAERGLQGRAGRLQGEAAARVQGTMT